MQAMSLVMRRDAPATSPPKAARKASKMAMQNPVIAQLDVALTKYDSLCS